MSWQALIGVCTVLSLWLASGALVFYAGQIKRAVDDHERRLGILEKKEGMA